LARARTRDRRPAAGFHTCKSGRAVAPVLLDVVQPTRAAVLARLRVARVRYGYLAQRRRESQRTLARETGLRVRRQLGDRASAAVLAPRYRARVTRVLPLAVGSDEQSGTAGNEIATLVTRGLFRPVPPPHVTSGGTQRVALCNI